MTKYGVESLEKCRWTNYFKKKNYESVDWIQWLQLLK